MSARLRIAVYLVILGAGTTGCGTSVEPKVGTGNLASATNALAEETAPQHKAADPQTAQDTAPARQAAERKRLDDLDRQGAYDVAEFMGTVPPDSVRIKVEVELRGTLSYTEQEVTLSLGKTRASLWVLEFGDNQEMRAKAKGLDRKAVLVNGSAVLRGIRQLGSKSTLDLERKVTVKSLVMAVEE